MSNLNLLSLSLRLLSLVQSLQALVKSLFFKEVSIEPSLLQAELQLSGAIHWISTSEMQCCGL